MALSSASVFVLFALGCAALAAAFVCVRVHADAPAGILLVAGLLLHVLLARGEPE